MNQFLRHRAHYVFIRFLLVIAAMSFSSSAMANEAEASAGGSWIGLESDRDPDTGSGFPFVSYDASANVGGGRAFALVDGSSASTEAQATVINRISPHPDYPHDLATARATFTDFINISSFLPGQAYWAYFDIQVHGMLTASGTVDPLNENSALTIAIASADVSVSARGNINQFINDPRHWQAAAPTFTPGGGTETLDDEPINEGKTYQLPVYFTPNYQIDITLRSMALVYLNGLPPSSAVPHGNAHSNFGSTVRWGNLRVTDIDGNLVPFTVTSESGYDWTQPIVPEGSSVLMALFAFSILHCKVRRLRRRS